MSADSENQPPAKYDIPTNLTSPVWWTPITTLFAKSGTLSLVDGNRLILMIGNKTEFDAPLSLVNSVNFDYTSYVFLKVNGKNYKLAFYNPTPVALYGQFGLIGLFAGGRQTSNMLNKDEVALQWRNALSNFTSKNNSWKSKRLNNFAAVLIIIFFAISVVLLLTLLPSTK